MYRAFGSQIKTFKFINKECQEIDAEVNKFLKFVTNNSGQIKGIKPLINDDGDMVFIIIEYVCSEIEMNEAK